MRLVVISDTHGNLPALKAVIKAIKSEGYDLLVHTGDAVAIGPYSRECVQLLRDMPNVELLMGEHDAWLAHGLASPNPPWLTPGEAEHHFWLSTAFPPEEKLAIQKWPYELEIESGPFQLAFTHYGMSNRHRGAARNDIFHPVIANPSAEELDSTFDYFDADLVFYGHTHNVSSVSGTTTYVNPGSLGCFHKPLARYVVAEFTQETYTLEERAVPYDDLDLIRAFEDRKVPERELIYAAFYGGRINPQSIYQL